MERSGERSGERSDLKIKRLEKENKLYKDIITILVIGFVAKALLPDGK